MRLRAWFVQICRKLLRETIRYVALCTDPIPVHLSTIGDGNVVTIQVSEDDMNLVHDHPPDASAASDTETRGIY